MEEILDCYSVKVAEAVDSVEGRPAMGPAFRCIYARDGLVEPPPGVQTCWEVFSESVKRSPQSKMLGYREVVNGKAGKYVWQTYEDVYSEVIKIGSAMRKVGMRPKDCCGVYGANCPRWMITLEACNGHSIYCVPLYDTLGEDAVEFIIQHAEVSIIFVHEVKLPEIYKSLPKCAKFVKSLVSLGMLSSEFKEEAAKFGVTAFSWDDFLELGSKYPADLAPPKPEDICTIMYTSGTTGEPKGVLLSNKSIMSCIMGVEHYLKIKDEKVDENDVYLSYLPLAHIFDRAVEEFFIFKGASIGFFQGDTRFLVDDIAELRPTLFVGVPRVFDRIYSGIQTKLAEGGSISKRIFDYAYKHKLFWMKKGYKQDKASPFFDKIVFSKVKQRLGGRVRLILSGAAPLSEHVEEFLRVTSCSLLTQGYGLTETCAGSFISVPDVMSMQGTVGPPLPVVEACLQSVPDMNYDALAETPRGEICIRGHTLFSGYHKREDLTNEVLVDGWFHTGDIGEWQRNGAMKIIDRKKNIFKLSQGEYVAVENLENAYSSCAAIDSIWVYGNSFEPYLVAVVVPNSQALQAWASSRDMKDNFEALCKIQSSKDFIQNELNIVAKENKLKGFEYIKALYLESCPFDIERDMLTPTFKKKRAQLLKYYQAVIDALYKDLKKK